MEERETFNTFNRMFREGSAFEHYIAQAWFIADALDRDRLEKAFADRISKYRR